MFDRIQSAIGIMVLNCWEVMWTVGRNYLFIIPSQIYEMR